MIRKCRCGMAWQDEQRLSEAENLMFVVNLASDRIPDAGFYTCPVCRWNPETRERIQVAAAKAAMREVRKIKQEHESDKTRT